MRRLSLGWRYARESFAIIRKDGALAALAAIGFALGLVLALGPLALAAWAFEADNDAIGWVAAAAAFLAFYVGLTFSGVAIAVAAAEVIGSGSAGVAVSLRAASRRLGPILGWSVVGTRVTVGFALARERAGRVGNVLGALSSDAWSLVTFLAVPVIAFEGLGPIATLRRSAG